MVPGLWHGPHMAVRTLCPALSCVGKTAGFVMRSRDNRENTQSGRRNFLRKFWLGLGIIALVESVGVVVAFLRPRNPRVKEGEFGGIIVAGAVDEFPPNSVTAFRRGHFYLSRLSDGGFLALSRKCTHLDCTVPWIPSENKFACPCHSSGFDITGTVISPPAPRPLDIYPVSIEHGLVKVDTGKPIQRKRFTDSHITYA